MSRSSRAPDKFFPFNSDLYNVGIIGSRISFFYPPSVIYMFPVKMAYSAFYGVLLHLGCRNILPPKDCQVSEI